MILDNSTSCAAFREKIAESQALKTRAENQVRPAAGACRGVAGIALTRAPSSAACCDPARNGSARGRGGACGGDAREAQGPLLRGGGGAHPPTQPSSGRALASVPRVPTRPRSAPSRAHAAPAHHRTCRSRARTCRLRFPDAPAHGARAIGAQNLAIRRRRPPREMTRDAVERALTEQVREREAAV
jgi:hypothetical protein